MMKKKNIYDDASLIKKSLIKDLSDKEQKELDQLLDDQSLQDVYKELSDRGYLKKQFMEYEKYSSQKAYREFKERRGHSGRIRIVRWGCRRVGVGIGCYIMDDFWEERKCRSTSGGLEDYSGWGEKSYIDVSGWNGGSR